MDPGWRNKLRRSKMKYKLYTASNFKTIPQIHRLTDEQIRAIEIVSSVLPFKTNNYVIDNLIDWSRVPYDPMFILTFPQKGMLLPEHYWQMEKLLEGGASKMEIKAAADRIRLQLNPHPAGQKDHNVPVWQGQRLNGFQHKYRETVVFFPSHGQTCHAYCTFCFRWPQFTGMEDLKFASKEANLLVDYVSANPEVTDVLFTGGDPMTMKAAVLATYIRPLLEAGIPHLRHIRIGSKSLAYWPYRFITDEDSDEILTLFKDVREAGKHLAFMAHFNHPAELEGPAVKEAIRKIQDTGAVIRTQSPLLRHINDSPEMWAEMWRRQVSLNCIPYYMFIARDTGAQHYFSVPLERAWQIFRQAYQKVSGICRTVRGPVMSCLPGKVQVLGVAEILNQKVFSLRMIQGRNPDWAAKPFFAEYNEKAVWFSDLNPAFGEDRFFFQNELDAILNKNTVAKIMDLKLDLVCS
jgi:KamA family protein